MSFVIVNTTLGPPGPAGPAGPTSTIAGPTGPTGPTGPASTIAGPTGPAGTIPSVLSVTSVNATGNITSGGVLTSSGGLVLNTLPDGSNTKGIFPLIEATPDGNLSIRLQNYIENTLLYTEYDKSFKDRAQVNTDYIWCFSMDEAAMESKEFITFNDNVNGELGSILVNSLGVFNYGTTSDYRLKYDIKPIINPLERCLKLKPVNYNFISDKNNTIHDGFIAHEVQDIIPNIVSGKKDDPNKMQNIDYSKFTPLLTGAVQELYKIIEKQSNDIQELYKIIEKQSNDNK